MRRQKTRDVSYVVITTNNSDSLYWLVDWLITFCVSRRQCKMYCAHARLCVCVCLSVCLSAAVCPHYCMDPDVTWGRCRCCPLVVHYWADLQSAHGLHCYGNIMQTLVYAGCVLVADYWSAGDGVVLKIARCISQVGMAGWPVTGRRRGVFSTLLRHPGLRASNGGILAT